MTRAIVARAPTRLDLGGGWTDVPPYPEREGGVVCNIAITRYATARVSRGGQTHGTDRLVRAALKYSGMSDVNGAVTSDFPVGAGLGGSSAAGVALAGSLAELAGAPLEPYALAALSRTTEVEGLGIAGGYQDHYAAAFGGALLLTFESDVGVEGVPLSAAFRAAFAQRAVLVYTGESRISGDTINAVRHDYVAGAPRVVNALARMKSLAIEMAAALAREDLDTVGALVGEHWTHQRMLHPSITTPAIDAITSVAARAGALGTKALGASGGGCVLAIAAAGRDDELVQALTPLGERITFAIDTTGFAVIARMDDE
ncbi:MAG: kinase [Gemmatimonadetes bacterium]|nr:kinase [Gemmatimonadota bacterium]